MDLEVLEARKALAAHVTLVWLLVRVSPDMNQHLVPEQTNKQTNTSIRHKCGTNTKADSNNTSETVHLIGTPRVLPNGGRDGENMLLQGNVYLITRSPNENA